MNVARSLRHARKSSQLCISTARKRQRRPSSGSASSIYTSANPTPILTHALGLPASVRIVEVGPRDGLQNETKVLSPSVRAHFVNLLQDSGLSAIEAASFVSSKWVPNMAGGLEVFKNLERKHGVLYQALVPNLKGMESALEAGVSEVAVFASASETFSQRNINCSIAESLKRFEPIMDAAAKGGKEGKVRVRGYVSCTLGCPYEGPVLSAAVAEVAEALYSMGCYEISLADTNGVGTPGATHTMLTAVSEKVPVSAQAVHFHDTYGQALANIMTALRLGIRVVDSAAGGLGGCPYAPGAAGNAATEDLVWMLHGCGVSTGVNLEQLLNATQYICGELGREPVSRVARALLARKKKVLQ